MAGRTANPNASQRATTCSPTDNTKNGIVRQRACRCSLGKPCTPNAVVLKSVAESTLPCRQKGAILCRQRRLHVRHFVSCQALVCQVAPGLNGSRQLLVNQSSGASWCGAEAQRTT